MEFLPKDILVYKICDDHLDLLDIFSLASTCKSLYKILSHFFDHIPAMRKKWTLERCILESFRMKNGKKMYQFYFKTGLHVPHKYWKDPFYVWCMQNDLEKVKHKLITYPPGDVEDVAEIEIGIILCIIYGSWECYDFMNFNFIEPKHLNLELFIESCSDVTLIGVTFQRYLEECLKRNLDQIPNFRILLMSKSLEFNDYELFHSYYNKEMDRESTMWLHLWRYLKFCDDPRFESVYNDFIGPKLIHESQVMFLKYGNYYFRDYIQKKLEENRKRLNYIGGSWKLKILKP
jgi:hypothetical protein